VDSLTHLLVGHAMGVAASSAAHPIGAAAYWAVLVGNSLPDIDVPVSLLIRRDVKLHRTVTHTIPGSALLSALSALVLHALFPLAPLGQLFGWTLLGCLVHMLLDCLNLFGARPFWPLSSRPVGLGVLHILDPILVVLLGLPAAGAALHLASPGLLSLSFALMWVYVLYRIFTARKLYHLLRRQGSVKARVVPWYLSWRYVFETAERIEFGHWARGRRLALQTYQKLDSPLVRASLAMPQVEAFLRAAEYPYAVVQEDDCGHAVVWGDALRQLRADFRPVRVHVDN